MSVKDKNPRGQWGMSKRFRKIQKSPLFFWQKLAKKMAKKHHSTLLTWLVNHWLVQKHQHFQAYCTDMSQKLNICPLKFPVLEILIAINSPKKLKRLNVWKRIDREPAVVFIQTLDKSDQNVPRKIDWERWNAEDFRDGKKWIHFDVSLCE